MAIQRQLGNEEEGCKELCDPCRGRIILGMVTGGVGPAAVRSTGPQPPATDVAKPSACLNLGSQASPRGRIAGPALFPALKCRATISRSYGTNYGLDFPRVLPRAVHAGGHGALNRFRAGCCERGARLRRRRCAGRGRRRRRAGRSVCRLRERRSGISRRGGP